MDETTFNRKTRLVVEIVQPRCLNRFGESPCAAVGTPKCYNVFWTCKDKANYDGAGSITWRFCRPQDNDRWLYEEADADNISTNCYPLVRSVSTTSSRINVGASRSGESPLGTRASVTITMQDAPWDDHVGDFYLGDRTPPNPRPGFWALWTVRNPLYPGIKIRVYEGYEGQALGDMQVRLYDLESVDGPDDAGRVTIKGVDPLDKARGKKAKFPPTSQIDLARNISDTETSIPVTCLESELDIELGNTFERKYIAIGTEIILYTGYTGTEPNLTLTGVERGQLDTVAEAHSDGDAVQRVGRFERRKLYTAVRDLLRDFGNVPSTYIPFAQWRTEGDKFLSTFTCTTTIPEPQAVEDLVGELCRDGMFSIWWDERLQRIPLLAVRPPQETPEVWTAPLNVVRGSLSRVMKPDDRLTRVTVFFNPRDPFDPIDTVDNYETRRVRVDGEVELPEASGGEIIENTIFSRWISTLSSALLLGASQLLRYRLPPQYVTLRVDAKDRAVQIGDVIDLSHPTLVDIEGNAAVTRWQVISAAEVQVGETVEVELQSYNYVGKFAIIMANDAPVYADATDEERLSGCWIAENTGLMPDGSDPYLLQ